MTYQKPWHCPHCGKELVWGVVEHIQACAYERQRQIDREFADRKAKPAMDKMKEFFGVTSIDVTPDKK